MLETLVDYLRRVAMNPWWVVAIELSLIGLVVYWLVDFLEGTRGERLFRGVIFILIVGFIVLKLIVGRFGFERLQYLYNGFLVFVLIIAVAGFQPEIRRALIRIGQPRFLARSSQRLARAIEEIVAATTALAQSKTGAIIVLERRVALGEFIDTGVRLNAEITAELLKTIFHPGTALHDMAVIIRDDRIVAARVQLPLAEPDTTDGTTSAAFVRGWEPGLELGSRHRAAIGITAGSDAICVVVSEESGVVSIAEDGKLIRGVSESDLRRYLVNAMGPTGAPRLAGVLQAPGRAWSKLAALAARSSGEKGPPKTT